MKQGLYTISMRLLDFLKAVKHTEKGEGMKQLLEDLINKADEVFANRTEIFTGEGLTRIELRQLERAGVVTSRLVRRPPTKYRPPSHTKILKWKMVPINLFEDEKIGGDPFKGRPNQ